VEACAGAGVSRQVVVVGHEADAVRQGLGEDLEYAYQREQRGSGHATVAAMEVLDGYEGDVLVVAGDVPLLTAETLASLLERHRSTRAAATLLTAILDDPRGYGRIVRKEDGSVARIVEHKDATPAERAIKEWNPSIYCFTAAALRAALPRIEPNNAQGEYYLTDAIGILAADGARIEALPVADSREVLGVNTRVELALVTSILRQRILERLMLGGVTVVDPASTYVDVGVEVGQDTVLHPQTFLLGRTRIGSDCSIGPMTRIVDCTVGNASQILASNVARSRIGDGVRIGPFAHLRFDCELAAGVKVGDYVELKNTILHERVSVGHLAYLGDAEIGAGTNIGAGVVTCNYDGAKKHRTVVGENAFVGSHVTLIAPITVGDGAYIGAGSPLDEDVPVDALAIARSRQTLRPGWAKRRRDAQK
jgi:bifunctional UDP-N-acetylglucosamine pyrophosphorylase/glucosamine-1-phosphate N-acetyltransferase